MDYLLHQPSVDVNTAALDEACGVGVLVTPEDIEQVVGIYHVYIKTYIYYYYIPYKAWIQVHRNQLLVMFSK